jgi:3'-phosphoadenosine 5'-phosphosulfate sulfotransferase (PAPS reductase)/FAD synthetase
MMYDQSYYDALEQIDYGANLHVIVSLSGGNSSAVAAERAIAKWGRERVELVFCDTDWEDDDLYRFLDDVERYLDMPITLLWDGRNPLQVGEDEHIIPNQFLAKCSDRLKIDVMQRHVRQYQAAGQQVVMVIGYDYRDAQPRGNKPQGRLPGTRKAWAKQGVLVDYPLLDKPVELDSGATVKAWGVQPQRMYALGYSHGNCGGSCVKQGKGDWRRTLTHFPERYAEAEAWERKMRENPTNAGYTFLRDERDGYGGNITLEQLRLETEAADARQLRLFAFSDDAGQVCGVECGIGWSEEQAA